MKINELKNLRKMRLSAEEKKALFESIARKIGYTPTPSPYFRFSYIFEQRYFQVGLMSFFLLLVSGATAFASLASLPGDVLYGVKTNIVENIPVLIHFNDHAKLAKYNSEKVVKRIQEFETLADNGKLTEDNTKTLDTSIKQNLNEFDQNTVAAPAPDQKDLQADLESKIEEHTAKIEAIRQEDGMILEKRQVLESVLERAHANKDDKGTDSTSGQNDGRDNDTTVDEKPAENVDTPADPSVTPPATDDQGTTTQDNINNVTPNTSNE